MCVLRCAAVHIQDYLETKRIAFPRFYFLSNEELLQILAQTRDAQAVQPHLRKCFDALVKLEFGKEAGSVDIMAMISPENEVVQFTKVLKVRPWAMTARWGRQSHTHSAHVFARGPISPSGPSHTFLCIDSWVAT